MSGEETALYYHGSEKFKGFSASALKIIAVVTMLCDHMQVVLWGGSTNILRIIGRIAFPIFAYMIAEGVFRTHDIKKYALRLFAFALLSEIPFDLGVSGTLFDLSSQNVMLTLLLGMLSVYSLKVFSEKGKTVLSLPVLLLCAGAAYFLCTDYSVTGVVCIYLFAFFRDCGKGVKALGFTAAIACLLFVIQAGGIYFAFTEIFAFISLIPILLYNGGRGIKLNKYFFYAFYPVHLLLLYLISMLIK